MHYIVTHGIDAAEVCYSIEQNLSNLQCNKNKSLFVLGALSETENIYIHRIDFPLPGNFASISKKDLLAWGINNKLFCRKFYDNLKNENLKTIKKEITEMLEIESFWSDITIKKLNDKFQRKILRVKKKNVRKAERIFQDITYNIHISPKRERYLLKYIKTHVQAMHYSTDFNILDHAYFPKKYWKCGVTHITEYAELTKYIVFIDNK